MDEVKNQMCMGVESFLPTKGKMMDITLPREMGSLTRKAKSVACSRKGLGVGPRCMYELQVLGTCF